MPTDLVRLPDCLSCGQPRWVDPPCACGHGSSSHNLNTANTVRTACSVSTGPKATECGCRRYEQGAT